MVPYGLLLHRGTRAFVAQRTPSIVFRDNDALRIHTCFKRPMIASSSIAFLSLLNRHAHAIGETRVVGSTTVVLRLTHRKKSK